MRAAGACDEAVARVVAACAEGYSFPTNLDLDQPVDGPAPLTQAEILTRAVSDQWAPARLAVELDAWSGRRRTDGRL